MLQGDDHVRQLGHTYSSVRNRKETKRQIVELSDSGVRFTGVYFDFQAHLDKDGTLWSLGTGGPGTGVALFRQPVTGFDKDDNPIYGERAAYCGYPKYKEALPYGGNPTAVSPKNGMAIFFGPGNHDGWHLGAIAKGGTDFTWLAAPSTGQGYQGAFPTDGYFQNGNGTNYPGGLQHVAGDFIFWNEHDEFYKASGQVNKWHVTDMNGLEVGVWGVTQSLRNSNPKAPPGMPAMRSAATSCNWTLRPMRFAIATKAAMAGSIANAVNISTPSPMRPSR